MAQDGGETRRAETKRDGKEETDGLGNRRRRRSLQVVSISPPAWSVGRPLSSYAYVVYRVAVEHEVLDLHAADERRPAAGLHKLRFDAPR